QKAFNTFYGGRPLFYSSGHHTSFTDRHSILSHRASRAHNTILPDGNNQQIGVEGYGWIPRYYNSDNINYVLGDASNAYGQVISPLWLERGRQSDVEFSKENGWDDNHVKTFRRHIVDLGSNGWILVYDELEADQPVSWHYLLHAVYGPIEFNKENPNFVHINTVNRGAQADAFLFSSGALACDTTDRFFEPATNWLKGDAKGNFKKYPNHHHFTAKTDKAPVYRFAALVNSHAVKHPSVIPSIRRDGTIRVPGWLINVNLSTEGKPSFTVRKEGDMTVTVTYEGEETIINDNGYVTTLTDVVPDLEI
ncbi:MAG: heparinase II/III family protein, partial [Muribaculaceae bacterium]|nr:heparinase II/III family protein [Muribaculaceae bacterium]